jgi:hypothetical protein
MCRFFLVAVYFLLRLPFDLAAFRKSELRTIERQEEATANKKVGKIAIVPMIARRAVLTSYGNAIVKPLLARDWNWKPIIPDSWKYYQSRHNVYPEWRFDMPILGIFDRLCLIGISVMACVPSFRQVRDAAGYLGMGMLIVLYAITGHFSFVIKDALIKSEEDHHELVEAARSYPDVVHTKEARTDYGRYNR